MQSISALVIKHRIFLSWLFGIAYLVFTAPPRYVPSTSALLYLIVGLEIAFLGEGLRIWANGYLQKDESLAVNGPFSYTRNPLYLGSFLIGCGFCIATSRLLLFVIFLVFFFLVFLNTIKHEEGILEGKFGSEFQKYKQTVPVFFPKASPYNSNVYSKFNWKQVKHNKEHLTVIGVLVIAIYAIIRYLLQYNTGAPYNKLLG
ncbi:MAG: isoprenylcysteine carboxylmethyltransferase family protein [bacterium]|nr:isoprenylcysteine carboxylmethyltransferase family protein [bacterium]